MLRPRQMVLAGGTFTAALAIGFVMQNGDALADRFGGVETPVGGPVAIHSDLSGPALLPPAPPARVAFDRMPAELSATVGNAPPVRLASLSTDMPLSIGDAPARSMPEGCTASLAATPGAAAMVDLVLDAPCAPLARATVHHQGMMFTTLTDQDGHAALTVPALSETAVFIVELPGDISALATADVPSLAFYDRAVLQWQQGEGLQIHAREFGANYGDAGHVWAASARDAAVAARGEGGFILRLGDAGTEAPHLAEVYSFPSGTTAQDGDVRLTVEAEVTETNCGRDIAAQAIQVDPEGGTASFDIEMAMPGCDAVGDFLVLNNVYRDLTLARN